MYEMLEVFIQDVLIGFMGIVIILGIVAAISLLRERRRDGDRS